MMSAARKRRQLRRQREALNCTFAADVFGSISARLADDLGFTKGTVAGWGAATAIPGAPDSVLPTMSERAARALRISRASNIPLPADANHDHGNALIATKDDCGRQSDLGRNSRA